MPKTISAGLQSHLALDETSLATLWRITRQDATTYHFTDHDVDIVFDGDTYESSIGYNRTAIANSTGLSVDNLDVLGFLDDSALTEADLRGGKFDFASVEIFLINWATPADGVLIARTGTMGEVSYSETGLFSAELRGLVQPFSQNMMVAYQSECRADLGDTKCKIPISVDFAERSTAYALPTEINDRFALHVQDAVFEITAENLGFDNGNVNNWTTAGDVDAVTIANGLGPQSGTHFLHGASGAGAGYVTSRTIDVTNALDLTQVDAGNMTFDFSVFQANSDVDDLGSVRVDLLDVDGNILSTPMNTTPAALAPLDVYQEQSVTGHTVVAGTRQVQIVLTGALVTGTRCNVAFDTVTLSFGCATEGISWQNTDNTIFEVTTAGTTAASTPGTVNTTPGVTTVDGTLTWTAREPLKRFAKVTAVSGSNAKVFTIEFDEPLAVDDWFNFGGVFFETGNNKGLVMEIKDWISSSSQVVLFLEMPFEVQINDRLTIYRGCDKLRATCNTVFDNVVNYRGEPDVPGADEVFQIPSR